MEAREGWGFAPGHREQRISGTIGTLNSGRDSSPSLVLT